MDVLFLGLLAYLAIETIMLPIAGLRGKDVRGRVITYLVVLIVTVALGVWFLGQRGVVTP